MDPCISWEESGLKGGKGRSRETGPEAVSGRVDSGLDSVVPGKREMRWSTILGVSGAAPVACFDGLGVRHESKECRGDWSFLPLAEMGTTTGGAGLGASQDSALEVNMLRLRCLLGVYTETE